jgi:hypothetical protein
MTLRSEIRSQILDYALEKGVTLTKDELRSAIAGVEYCVSECMAESVQIAVSNVAYDREENDNA